MHCSFMRDFDRALAQAADINRRSGAQHKEYGRMIVTTWYAAVSCMWGHENPNNNGPAHPLYRVDTVQHTADPLFDMVRKVPAFCAEIADEAAVPQLAAA